MKNFIVACRKILTNFKIVADEYGQFRSMIHGRCLNKNNQPLAWYTYPALEYLNQLDFSQCTVFEYGSGQSSLFWAERAHKVISVEHDKEWFQKINLGKPTNLQILFCENEQEYTCSIASTGIFFDVIVIDGPWRLDCARQALPFLSKGGIIILDNSDWFERALFFLRESSLLGVDFCGLGPLNHHAWSTSIFFDYPFQIPRQRKSIQSLGGVSAPLIREIGNAYE